MQPWGIGLIVGLTVVIVLAIGLGIRYRKRCIRRHPVADRSTHCMANGAAVADQVILPPRVALARPVQQKASFRDRSHTMADKIEFIEEIGKDFHKRVRAGIWAGQGGRGVPKSKVFWLEA